MLTKQQVIDVVAKEYTLDRVRRLEDLVAGCSHLQDTSIDQFGMFVGRYGKIADDLALFVSPDGYLEVNWSVAVDHVSLGGRRQNNRTICITFTGDMVVVCGPNDSSTLTYPASVECWSSSFDSVIDLRRTHRLTL